MNFKTHYLPVCWAKALKVDEPLQVWFHQKPVVLVRTNGKISAFSDYCPHRGVPLSLGKVIDNELHCPYHGWSFSCLDGKNTLVPVKGKAIDCGLKTYHVVEQYGLVWVSDTDTSTPTLLADMPTLTTAGTIGATFTNSIENFLEGSHTHYVHEGLIRSKKAKRQCINAVFEPNDSGFKVYYEAEKPKGLITKLTPKRYQNLRSVATYIFPYIAILEYINEQEEVISRFEGIISPGKEHTNFFARIFLNVGVLTPVMAIFAKRMFEKVIAQDKAILEIQAKNIALHKDHHFNSDSTDLVGTQLFAWLHKPENILQEKKEFTLRW